MTLSYKVWSLSSILMWFKLQRKQHSGLFFSSKKVMPLCLQSCPGGAWMKMWPTASTVLTWGNLNQGKWYFSITVVFVEPDSLYQQTSREVEFSFWETFLRDILIHSIWDLSFVELCKSLNLRLQLFLQICQISTQQNQKSPPCKASKHSMGRLLLDEQWV